MSDEEDIARKELNLHSGRVIGQLSSPVSSSTVISRIANDVLTNAAIQIAERTRCVGRYELSSDTYEQLLEWLSQLGEDIGDAPRTLDSLAISIDLRVQDLLDGRAQYLLEAEEEEEEDIKIKGWIQVTVRSWPPCMG